MAGGGRERAGDWGFRTLACERVNKGSKAPRARRLRDININVVFVVVVI